MLGVDLEPEEVPDTAPIFIFRHAEEVEIDDDTPKLQVMISAHRKH